MDYQKEYSFTTRNAKVIMKKPSNEYQNFFIVFCYVYKDTAAKSLVLEEGQKA